MPGGQFNSDPHNPIFRESNAGGNPPRPRRPGQGPTGGVMRVQVAHHPAAAVEPHEDRQIRFVPWVVKADVDFTAFDRYAMFLYTAF